MRYQRQSAQGTADPTIQAIKSIPLPNGVKKLDLKKVTIGDKKLLDKAQFTAGTWKFGKPDEPLEAVRIESIIVDPKFQDKGIATQMLQNVVDVANDKGAILILQAIPIGNKKLTTSELVKFYEKLGFKVVILGSRPILIKVPQTQEEKFKEEMERDLKTINELEIKDFDKRDIGF